MDHQDMPLFLSVQAIDQTARALGASVGAARESSARQQLLNVYRLLRMLPDGAMPVCSRPTVLDGPEAEALGFGAQLAWFVGDAAPGFGDRLARGSTQAQRARTAASLSRLLLDPCYGTATLSLVFAVVCSPIPFFGSHRRALGLVFAGPQDNDGDWDLEQLLLHEVVHQGLFVAELAHGLFADAEVSSRNEVVRLDRPYAMAFHAAFVCWTLAERAWRSERIAESAVMLHKLRAMIPGLQESSSQALEPSGHALLSWLIERDRRSEWTRRVVEHFSEAAAEEYARGRPRSYLASRD